VTITPELRLSMGSLPEGRLAAPPYDRSGEATIAHLGMGAFARAHLAVYADDLLRSGWPAMIRAVSLRTRQAESMLDPQDGLFTVTEREPDAPPRTQVVGSVQSATTGPESAIEAVASPSTRLVTLTVTESGYERTPDGFLPFTPSMSLPVVAVLALGLDAHRRHGRRPPVVASMDNVLDNGATLRERVVEIASRIDRSLPAWIESEVHFPSSVVDRMVPATTAADLDDIRHRVGLSDLAAVSAEHHRSWYLQSAPGLPPLDDVGVCIVGDIAAHQRRKLWLLNGPHSALAYGGLLVGCRTIAESAADPTVTGFVERLVADILAVVDLPDSLRPQAFAAEAMQRFRNPTLGHTCVQVGGDGSRKLAQRLYPVVALRRARGLPTDRPALVVAAWLASAARIPVQGSVLPTVADPLGPALTRAAADGDLPRVVQLGLGSRAADPFAGEVAAALQLMVRNGPAALHDGC
jgi:fructuronate reductase